MKEERIPARKNCQSDEEILDVVASKNFLNPAPAITGPESMKANLAASSLFSFKNRPAEIVDPEREMPGIKASA